MRVLPSLAVGLGLLLAAAPAHADDVVTYSTDGEAPSGADARTAALDVAFKAATRAAVDDLVTTANQAAHKDVLDADVRRRARLWVASFKVTRERTDGGTLKLEVDVRIDHAKLRAKLTELGVPVRPDADDRGGAEPDPDAVTTRSAALLVRVSTGDGAVVSFGPDADELPLLVAALPLLATRGVVAVPPPTGGGRIGAGRGLPVDDGEARALAGEVHADVVVIAGLEIGATGRVRGTREIGVMARARVRALDLGAGRALGDADAVRGARSSGDGGAALGTDAARWAMLDALARALPMVREVDPSRTEPALAAGASEVLVRVRGTGRELARRVRAQLAGAAGVKSAKLRRVGAGGVVIAVTGANLRPDRVAQILRAGDIDVKAKVVDEIVVVTEVSP